MTRLVGGALAVLVVAALLLALAWDAAGRAAREDAALSAEPPPAPHAESAASEEAHADPAPRKKMDANKERRLAVMRAELASTEADRDEAAAQLEVDRAEAAAASSEHDGEDLQARDELAMLDALVAAQAAQVSQYEAMVRAKEAEIRIAERRGEPATDLGA